MVEFYDLVKNSFLSDRKPTLLNLKKAVRTTDITDITDFQRFRKKQRFIFINSSIRVICVICSPVSL